MTMDAMQLRTYDKCGECGAKVGAPCRNPNGVTTSLHKGRRLRGERGAVAKRAQSPAALSEKVVPPSDLYYCPTGKEIESRTHGGFDQCCDHPTCPGPKR